MPKALLMRVCGVTMAAGLLWFAVNLIVTVGPGWLLWVPTGVGAVIVVTMFARAAAAPGLPAPTRRFWRQLTAAACLVGAGSIAQAVDVVANPDVTGPHTGPAMLSFHAAAVVIIIYSLYRLPLGVRAPGDSLRIALDAAIVVAAAGVFIWHFATRPALGSENRTTQVASLAVIVLSLVAILGVAKVVLSSHAFVDGSALRLLAVAMFCGSLFPMVWPPFESRWPHLLPAQFGMPVIFLLAAFAAERQRTAGTPLDRATGVADRRRTFSLLPYAAVAAADGLLVADAWVGDDRAESRVIVAVAVVLMALVILRQVTVLRDNSRLLVQLDHSATHDALTGLPNRVLFNRRLAAALNRPGRVSVALVDLDDFKEVNDTLGHDVGDLLLTAVSDRFRRCVDTPDTVARLGGDEFVVVIDNADPLAADRTAQRMIDALRDPVVVGGHTLAARASIGIADGHAGDDPGTLLRCADIAMYAAKKVPGTAYVRYNTRADFAHTL